MQPCDVHNCHDIIIAFVCVHTVFTFYPLARHVLASSGHRLYDFHFHNVTLHVNKHVVGGPNWDVTACVYSQKLVHSVQDNFISGTPTAIIMSR